MFRVIRVGAHVEYPYIQQMRVVASGIRHTPAEVAAPLHQEKVGRLFRQTHQVNGQQSTGETGSHNANSALPPGNRWCGSHPMSPLCPLCRSVQLVDGALTSKETASRISLLT